MKKPSFHTHNIKLTISPEMNYWLNTLSYSTAGLAPKLRVWFLWQLFLDPVYISLEWHFGANGWSWLSCIGAWRAGQATKGWQMSVFFNLEYCEHKKGPVGPQTGPLAFNCLLYSYIKPTHHPYYYHLQYHYHHKKSCSKQLEFRVFESYSPTQL